MEPRTHRDELHPTSRLNYAKTFTVEYNVKVNFIGKIHKDSVKDFVRDYNQTHTSLPDPEFSDPVQGQKNLVAQESTRTKTAIDTERANSQDTSGKLKRTQDNAIRTDVIARTSPDTGLLPENSQHNLVHSAQESRIESELKSSSSSIGSDDAGSIFTQSDMASSATSVDADPIIELLTLFFEDQRLSALFSEAPQTILPARFEQKMRQLLLKFAKNLRAEAKSKIERDASRTIKHHSRNIASSLGKRIYPVRALELDDPRFQQPLDLEKWRETVEPGRPDADVASASEIEDSEKENGGGDEKTSRHSNLQLHLLEAFIKPSQALSSLADDFSLFLKASEVIFHASQDKALREDYDWTYEGLPDPDFRTTRRATFDSIHKAISKSWPESEGYLSIVSVEYNVYWEVPQFLDAYFEKGQRLQDLLTLTGNSDKAQALACGEYLKKHWPSISDPLLAAIEELISTSTRGYTDAGNVQIAAQSTSMLDGKPSTNQRLAIFTVEAAFDDHHDILSAISWICAAVRHGETEGLSVSKVYLETTPASDEHPRVLLKLCPLTPIDENGSCRQSLFAHTVIAYDFPISSRQEGQGLELSFQDMLILARSLRLTLYDSGLVAEGLDTLLIPIKDLDKDKGLQWHLAWRSSNRHEGSPISILDILEKNDFQEMFYADDPQFLADKKRTFLGWTEEARVVLGTERFVYDPKRVGRSSASVLRNVGSRFKMWSTTLGTYAILGINLSAQFVMKQAFDGNFMATRRYDDNFHDRLQDSAKRNVIISNWSKQTSWYLPETSTILYMIHLYINLRGYVILPVGNETSDINHSNLYAKAHSDGGAAARETLTHCMRLRLSAGDTVFRMDDLVGKYLLEFEQERQELQKVLKTARELNNAPPGYIVGYELLDVVQMLGNRQAKVCELIRPQPWTHLTEETPVLWVYDLDQAIVPYPLNNLCDSWREVPEGRNYLVAAAPAVQYLIEGRGVSGYQTRYHGTSQPRSSTLT
jgi:hypothetical protein